MKNLKFVITSTMIISYSPVAHSQISGNLDTLLETDQTSYYSRSRIEEQADINWRNKNNDMNAGLQFDFRHEEIEQRSETEKNTDPQINQLFFAHQLADISYTLGRFNRSDQLGFYTLDGLIIKYKQKNWDSSLFAGKPIQIEDYNLIDAGRTYGFDINYHANILNNSIIQKTNSYLGWQQLRDNAIQNDVTQNYIHWRFSGQSGTEQDKAGKDKPNQLEMFFNGSYLVENKSAETINTGIQFYAKDIGLTRLAYTSWKPEHATLSFKEQFYSVYANGKQSTLQADFFHDYKWKQQIYLRGRKVWREFGNDGYGATAGFEKTITSHKSSGWQTQWDSLVLKDDVIHSLYTGINKDLSATLRGHFNTAVQYKKNSLTGSRNLIALEAVAQQMLASDLFIDFNARYIYNDSLRDEYRIGFRLSYRFDDRIGSR